ncbi:FG-GAP-like repeat-containing protein [Actinoplanes sp. NPDC051861]|uniref:FG-GAP-like repeat-containing protein n=1 Tax=Actinoplanes sp. NPDC051861 TaxID=3155170 RepID=UPI00342AB057
MGARSRWVLAATAAVTLVLSGPAPARAATTVVDTKAELLAALASAVAGDTVFVDGAAEIDLTGTEAIAIPAGVTLAGDRGQNGSLGARLFNTTQALGKHTWAQFTITGAGTRVTGLRLEGPEPGTRTDPYVWWNADGIVATRASDTLIDNNELSGWSHAAVTFLQSIEGRVRGNHIHHNQRTGLGYGVMVHDHSSAVIEDNRFNDNRHAIAGTGFHTERYEARFNVVTNNPTGHQFDMHGEDEEENNDSPYAGDVLHIKNNTFQTSKQKAVIIRGRPRGGATISGNCFAHANQTAAIEQQAYTGNLTIGSNSYSAGSGTCHQSGRRVAWQLSSGGTSSWAPIAPYTFDVSEVGFGDFDGDGRTDVFRATGYRWYYSPGGTGPFQPLAVSADERTDLRFGDFDGDGKTDVFKTDGTRWYYSSAGTSAWTPLALSGEPIANLRFGDFNGDGRTDVFMTAAGQWRYASGGASSWTNLATAGEAITALRFGDFNGDGRTDVFSTTGSQWRYSSGGAASWQSLALSGEAIGNLRFADFNGDGRTDVFTSSNSQWKYSSGGAGSWINLTTSGCPLAGLYVDDFNGDNKADVFDGRCGG